MKSAIEKPSGRVLIALLGVAAMLGFERLEPWRAQAIEIAPAILQPARCYQLTFAVPSSTTYKVLELLDDGWIRAEADVGPSNSHREPIWINTAQIIAVRQARCSD